MDFLFHKVSEKERAEIKRQAKGIMDKFSEKISKVKSKIPEPLIEREEFERQEAEPLVTSSKRGQSREEFERLEEETHANSEKSNSEFRQRMFENAPKKNKDFILTEKKKW